MKDVYERNALAFDEQRGKSLFEKKWLDRFTQLLNDGDHILDVGCGSAEPIAKYFIESGYLITGLDFSENMIKLAKSKYPHLNWKVEDMRTFNLNYLFDGLIAWNSFFHLNPNDQPLALNCFAKHLKINGLLMVTIGHEKGEVLGAVNGDEVYHSSMTIEEYEQILKDLNLDIIDYQLQDPDCHGHSILMAKKVK